MPPGPSHHQWKRSAFIFNCCRCRFSLPLFLIRIIKYSCPLRLHSVPDALTILNMLHSPLLMCSREACMDTAARLQLTTTLLENWSPTTDPIPVSADSQPAPLLVLKRPRRVGVHMAACRNVSGREKSAGGQCGCSRTN